MNKAKKISVEFFFQKLIQLFLSKFMIWNMRLILFSQKLIFKLNFIFTLQGLITKTGPVPDRVWHIIPVRIQGYRSNYETIMLNVQ